jgi:hypothetical protein
MLSSNLLKKNAKKITLSDPEHMPTVYLSVWRTLSQLRLEILTGLSFGDLLLKPLWIFINSLGPTCGLKAVFRIRIHRIHRIHVFFSLPDPDPSTSCKNNKKNLESYYFVTLNDFLSLKNNVNVPSKSNKQNKLC